MEQHPDLLGEPVNHPQSKPQAEGPVCIDGNVSYDPKENGFMQRLGGVCAAVHEDLSRASLPQKGVIATAITAQILDRVRVAEVAGPTIAFSVFGETGNKWLAAGSLMSLIYSQQHISGVALGAALNHAPDSLVSVNKNFPAAAKFAENFAPSGKGVKSVVREAIGGFGLGTMPFIVAQKMAVSKNEVDTGSREYRSLSHRISKRTAVFGGMIALGAFTALEQAPTSPIVQAGIDHAKSPFTWLGLALTSEAGRFLSNKLRKHKLSKA